MTIDYDLHLKPATDIKKISGEDAAIDYLVKLFQSESWDYNSVFAILDKMTGYYRKANLINKTVILSKLDHFLDIQDNVNFDTKVSAFINRSQLFIYEKNYEMAFNMLCGAVASCHFDSSNYFYVHADIFERQSKVIALKGINETDEASQYLYHLLSFYFLKVAWLLKTKDRNQIDFMKTKCVNYFPFNQQVSKKSFNLLYNESLLEIASLEFCKILFDDFVKEYPNFIHQASVLIYVDEIVNNYKNYIINIEN
jgi:hypothetical protein